MRKLSDVIFEQRPLIMNETASVMAACERMRDSQARAQQGPPTL